MDFFGFGGGYSLGRGSGLLPHGARGDARGGEQGVVVADYQQGRPGHARALPQQGHGCPRGFWVQSRGGFVGQDQPWPVGQGPGHGGALAFSVRKGFGQASGHMTQAEEFQQGVHAAGCFRLRGLPCEAQRQADIVLHGQKGVQAAGLVHKTQISAAEGVELLRAVRPEGGQIAGAVFGAQHKALGGGGARQQGQHFQQGAFATAAGPGYARSLAGGHVQACDAGAKGRPPGRMALVEIADFQQRRRHAKAQFLG